MRQLVQGHKILRVSPLPNLSNSVLVVVPGKKCWSLPLEKKISFVWVKLSRILIYLSSPFPPQLTLQQAIFLSISPKLSHICFVFYLFAFFSSTLLLNNLSSQISILNSTHPLGFNLNAVGSVDSLIFPAWKKNPLLIQPTLSVSLL